MENTLNGWSAGCMWELDHKEMMRTEELMLSNCGVGKDSGESLDCKETKPVNYKGNFKILKTLCLPSPHTHPRFHWKITYIEKSVDSTYHNCKASQSFTNWTYPCNEHLDKKQNTNSVFWPSPARLPLNDYNDSTTTALLLAAAEITGWFALRLHFVMSQ